MKEDKEKLTEKEEEIMFLIWEHGPCSVKELVEYYSDPKPHVNTISTFVRTLESKGFVGHEQGRYGSFNYFAIKPKADYQRSAFSKIVGRYFGNCFSMVSHLVEEKQLDTDQLRQLIDMIDKQNKK